MGSNMPRKLKSLSVYERIVRAADKGKGLCLTPEQVECLAGDTAIRDRAEMDQSGCEEPTSAELDHLK